MTVRSLLSPAPWSWRRYENNDPFLALVDARENELGFTWVAIEDVKALAAARERATSFVARSRAELERNLTAICAAMNGEVFGPEPATPRPWRIIRGRGWKDELVLSVVGPGGHDDEVTCRPLDKQTEIDFAAIVAAVNARWP